MEGWLLHEKRTVTQRRVWKLRYFVIMRGYVLYPRPPAPAICCACIPLAHVCTLCALSEN
jgi:hypothetical protein